MKSTGIESPGRGTRWKRIFLIAGVGLVVLAGVVYALGPTLAASLARSRIGSELSREFDATVRVGDLSLGWSGDVELSSLTITPRAASRPLIDTDRVQGRFSLPSLLKGRVVGRLDVLRPRIALERDRQGDFVTGRRESPRTDRASEPSGEDLLVTVREGTLSVGGQGTGVEGTFDLHLRSRAGRLEGSLSAVLNGGRVRAMIQDSPVRSITVEAQSVGASAEMAPLLERISPLFYTVGGRVEGVLDAKVDLTWQGDLSPATLAGTGSLSATRLRIVGSPTAQAVLEALGEDELPEGELRVGDLAFADGVCRYRDMVWKAGRHELRFEGAVGVDGRLELEVEAPLSERLLRKLGLERWAGRTARLPLRGTVRQPRLDLQRLLESSAESGIEGELEKLFKQGLRGSRK